MNPLKKLVSIFFLAIFVFNVGGYYAVFWIMQKQANTNLVQRLEANQYTNQETVTLSIPLTIPYPVYQNDYVRVEGDFEYQGERYKLVKQKFTNDTLFVICIKNHESKKITAALTTFSKLSNDLPTGSKRALNFLAKLFKDFTTTNVHHSILSQELLSEVEYFDIRFDLSFICYPVDSPPPKSVS